MIFLIFFYFLLFTSTTSYKYLVISPIYSFSHVKFMSNLADTLADAGHNVTVLQPQLLEALRAKKVIRNENVRIIDVEHNEAGKRFYENRPKSTVTKYWTENQAASFGAAKQFAETMTRDLEHMCVNLFTNTNLHTLLTSQNYDVAIAEPFDPCGLYLADYLKIPSIIIAMASARIDPVQWSFGQPSALNFIPGPGSRYGKASGIWDRVNNVWMFLTRSQMFQKVYENVLEIVRRETGLGKIRNLDEIIIDSPFLFFNSNPYLDFPFPSITKCVQIGGFSMNISTWKPDRSLDFILNKRAKNVFISFGSVIRSADMPISYKKGLARVISTFPDVTFLWKYEEEPDEFLKNLENVHFDKWFPQTSLLVDSRVKLFITHGGLGSVNEVAYTGKPAIVVPLFFDQPMNGEMLSRHGGSEIFSKFDLGDAEKLEILIRKMLEDPSYAENSARLAELLKNQPIDPVQKLVSHAEFAAKFKKLPELEPYSKNLSFLEFYFLDVISMAILALVLITNNLASAETETEFEFEFNDEICSADECNFNKTWTSEQKCAYIKCNPDACEGGGYLQWSEYVKCEYKVGVRVILIILAIIYLFCLFVIMTVVADDFFSPSITGIVSHLRMSESIAGVTFLAFGNGAPDVFGSIASILTTPTPKADLALGDLFGGGIFVTTVVLSAIILTKSFKIAIIPTIRDILFYLVTLAFILFCFLKYDRVHVWMPATFLGIYACYVASVILLSVYRKRRKQAKNLREDQEKIRNSGSVEVAKLKAADLLNFMVDFSHIVNIFQKHRERKNTCFINEAFHEEDNDEGQEAEFGFAHGHVYTSHDQLAPDVISTKKSMNHFRDVFEHLKSWPSREEFREMTWFGKIVAVIKVIPVFFFKLTIPSNEMSWCKPMFLIYCFTSIQFALFAIQIINTRPGGGPGLWLYGLGVSALLAALAIIFTPLNREQRWYKEVYSYLGFLMSIAWIYVTSNEIIGVITMIGVVTGLSQELLGLTILAWSNCIGDVVADIAVVKQGFPKMAMAAAIGGPLFNLLIGFGLPFTIAAAQGKEIELLINPVYRLLMLFLGISLVTTLVALFIQRFRVTWPHAVVLIFIFVTFIVFIVLAEFHVLEWK
ncbi:unnamed protein product [Caenorhabditis angaria]|uniref:glucuronosyltransferase n=1 Tax=Caenorhabditis angaria TaxID=860376 RepID=A0A9P1IYY1_9PELO|nr:unnamed protein product [Caenorhabditis angaria]